MATIYLRVDDDLAYRLKERAKKGKMSLNKYLTSILEVQSRSEDIDALNERYLNFTNDMLKILNHLNIENKRVIEDNTKALSDIKMLIGALK